MARSDARAMFDVEIAALAALAAGLSDAQWGLPSCCAGWTVGDVIAHTAFHTHRRGLRETLAPADSVMPRVLAREGADTRSGLVAMLGRPAPESARSSMVNVCELVIHQQDVRRVVDEPRAYPPATMRAVLDLCASTPGAWFVLGRRRSPARGLRLEATDIGWASGSGASVAGEAEAVLMGLAGRPVVLDGLRGPGADVLRARAVAHVAHEL